MFLDHNSFEPCSVPVFISALIDTPLAIDEPAVFRFWKLDAGFFLQTTFKRGELQNPLEPAAAIRGWFGSDRYGELMDLPPPIGPIFFLHSLWTNSRRQFQPFSRMLNRKGVHNSKTLRFRRKILSRAAWQRLISLLSRFITGNATVLSGALLHRC